MFVFYLNVVAVDCPTPFAAWPWAEGTFETQLKSHQNESQNITSCIVPFLNYQSVCQIFPCRYAADFLFPRAQRASKWLSLLELCTEGELGWAKGKQSGGASLTDPKGTRGWDTRKSPDANGCPKLQRRTMLLICRQKQWDNEIRVLQTHTIQLLHDRNRTQVSRDLNVLF